MTTAIRKSRKQEILDAALACFNEHGIEATTIEMIRERSGASVGSVYHHFGSKEVIAATLYIESIAGYHVYQKELLAQAVTPQEGVKAVTYAYIDWVSENPDRARFVLYNRGVIAKAGMAKELQEQSRQKMSEVFGWFKPFIAKGELKNLPLECYGSLITGPSHDYARLWLSERTHTDIKAYREIFADAAWNSVRPE